MRPHFVCSRAHAGEVVDIPANGSHYSVDYIRNTYVNKAMFHKEGKCLLEDTDNAF